MPRMDTSAAFIALAFSACLGSNVLNAHAAETSFGPVVIARATTMPACTSFVDASSARGDGTVKSPFKSIAAAIQAAAPAAVICVAQGVYAEALSAGEKDFTLAGGFQSGKDFKVRDSATYVSKAQGKGGSFLRIEDPGPKGDQLTAIDGFEITGYAQAIVRDYYEAQRFDVTNNFIHDNTCTDVKLSGAGFALNNILGTIRGNVFQKNTCGRGGAGFLNGDLNKTSVTLANNFVDGNSGTEPESAHGGGLYLFGTTLKITGNLITNNSVTHWGGGLYVGAYTEGNQPTTATLSHNVYRGNRAGERGGGFFCDDGATCIASHEIYDRNCGGNILVDGGSGGSGPTTTKFDYITNAGALDASCKGPGDGLLVDNYEALAPDSHVVSNAIFWGNAPERDFATACAKDCDKLKVSVTNSMVQTKYKDGSVKIAFGPGNIAPADPLFVARETGDFHLKAGSPAIGKGAYGDEPAALDVEVGVKANVAAAPAPAQPTVVADAAEPAGSKPQTAPPVAAGRDAVLAQTENVPAKQAFEDAKLLNTVAGWNAFLKIYKSGFYSNLARAYLTKLEGNGAETAPAEPKAVTLQPAPSTPPSVAAPAGPAPAAVSRPVKGPVAPAVKRAGTYMGFAEKFNRYYTDPAWLPSQIVYASPKGSGNGATREAPMPVKAAVAAAKPGTMIYFLRGAYEGGFEFSKDMSGTYDEPVVLFAERNPDKSIGVSMTCAFGKRLTCFNFEGADYIAVDGFDLSEGKYGVRAVGLGFPASQHSRGIAILNSTAHDQLRDPVHTAQSDWVVLEQNIAFGAKKEDGHGFYLSGGGDWSIVRFNETYGNLSSDFQINADPNSSCKDAGVPFDDPKCDAYAGEGEGGQGASDYVLVDGNYFHHGLAQGANFTSVRRSIIRNNIFGPQTRHNVSFWQETDNPKLGTSDNKILHNLFITTGRHAVQFVANSTRNLFANNVIAGVKIENGAVTANPSALLMEVDNTASANVYSGNLYVSGKLEGRTPNENEKVRSDFSSAWFAKFPAALNHDAKDYTPAAGAPFIGVGTLLPDAPVDRSGIARSGKADLGPIELP